MKTIIDVRSKSPLIHHLTNQVVMNFTANGLLAFGGVPIMAKAKEEAKDMASIADGVLINIGTITPPDLSAMILAGKTANARDIPVVLDPVGVASTPFRDSAIRQILEEVHPTAIKGNAGEMAHLVQIPWETRGVESIGEGNAEEIAMKVAETYQTTAVVTGKSDIVASGSSVASNETGHPLLSKITGAGCLLGSILTACLTTDESIEKQALAALTFYGLAAEYAAEKTDVNGPGSFLPQFIDALSLPVDALGRVSQ